MGSDFAFHPGALAEYGEATEYYLKAASPTVAERYVRTVESAVADLVHDPARWRVVEEPGIRRYVLPRFPLVLFYRCHEANRLVTIYAVMHGSRMPGYWRHRAKGTTFQQLRKSHA